MGAEEKEPLQNNESLAKNLLLKMRKNNVLEGEQRVRMLDLMRAVTIPEEHQLLTKYSNEQLALMVINVLFTAMNTGNKEKSLEMLEVLVLPTQEYRQNMDRMRREEEEPITNVQRFFERVIRRIFRK